MAKRCASYVGGGEGGRCGRIRSLSIAAPLLTERRPPISDCGIIIERGQSLLQQWSASSTKQLSSYQFGSLPALVVSFEMMHQNRLAPLQIRPGNLLARHHQLA